MMRCLSDVGKRTSCLLLLGASTILLAAAGEAIWHSNASATKGRWAGPTAGVVAASSVAAVTAVTAELALASESESEMLVIPDFKPFVYVELPLPSGCSLLPDPGVHMNNDGVVVATMNNGSANYGYIWYDEKYADGWLGPLEDGSGDIVLDNAGLRGINDELEICGTRTNSGPKAFFLALTSDYTGTATQIGTSNGYAKDVNNQGVVVGTSAGGSPIGWWDIIGSPVPLPGNGTNALGVTPNTTLANSLIVGQAKGSGSVYQAALWYYDTSWNLVELTNNQYTSEVGFAVDANDNEVVVGGILTSGSISDTIHWYYDAVGDEWDGVSLAVSTAFIPEAINDQANPEIVGDKYLWVSTSVTSGTGEQIDLSSMSLGLPSNMIGMRCTDINDAGEVVGVGQLGSGGAWVAFKLVPYDVNNNGESDVREIVQGIEADSNTNWLIDWAETDGTASPTRMRVGLHSPNSAAGPEGSIEPGQIVRLGANVGPLGIQERPQQIANEDWIPDIVAPQVDCEACEKFHTAVHRWGTGEGRDDENLTSEILIRVHSMMGTAAFGDYEALPDPDAPEDKKAALADLKLFAFRFARCIDFLQWGNESFGGAREYAFRGNEFDSECDFTGAPKTFTELSTACKQEAVDLILSWQNEMMWAALEGSALSGRPLRMTSCGITMGNVINGYDCQNNPVGCYLVSDVSEWCNANQMYFSMHVHYETVAEATEAVEKLVDSYSGNGAPWDVPNWRICTEVGSRATSHSWWNANTFEEGPTNTNINQFRRFFFVLDPPADPVPTYEEFVTEWSGLGTQSTGQWGSAGPQLDTVFDAFADAGFAGVCWSTHQWDKGTEEFPSVFLIEALQANGVLEDDYFGQYNEENRYTPLMTLFESAGADHAMSTFTPHAFGCDFADVCPGCE